MLGFGVDERVDARLREPERQADRAEAGAFRGGCDCDDGDLGAERVELAYTSFDPRRQPFKLELSGRKESAERASHRGGYDVLRGMGQLRERN